MPKLVLASSSPYRRGLLERLGLDFEVTSPHVDETALPGERPEQLVRRLSEAKARAVADAHPDSLIIGSDQVAIMDGEIIGKPGSHEQAVEQLRRASGRRVEFLTGLALLNSASGRVQVDAVPIAIVFRPLSDAQIDRYLRKDQPYNCAGSFRSERLGVALFERYEGDDPNTVVGLPLIRLVRMLENEGMSLY
jgi:septum formation protein